MRSKVEILDFIKFQGCYKVVILYSDDCLPSYIKVIDKKSFLAYKDHEKINK